MSVRAYHLRRKAYRQTAKPVGIPGKPSTTNRKARRAAQRALTELARLGQEIQPEYYDPDPPLKCDCGQCLPGQDRECPARAIARAERLMDDR